jgi:hypothetical protein
MLVGYDDETKGYHYYNLNIHTLFINSDVRINEGYFGHAIATIVGQPFVTLEPITNKFVMINVYDPSSNFTREELSFRCNYIITHRKFKNNS